MTLNINELQEKEELQEMIQSVTGQFYRSAQTSSIGSSGSGGGSGGGGGSGSGSGSYGQNTNRERQKYNHPKGAPDADLIFGPSSSSGTASSANSARYTKYISLYS